MQIAPSQIDEDLAQLARITDCVRTYSVDFGLENVPEIAQRHGLKVLLGLWVSSHADRTKLQIDTGIALARRFPDTIQAVIVGNEALLRGEVSADALAGLIATVKKQVAMPVTYADVWEFWLRHRQLEKVTDFVTVHILPYWEDEPIAAGIAADHIDSIRKRVAGEFPGREMLIGEVGWPSAGRMREGALPSPSAQARVMHDLLARAKSGGYRVNIIEAFDQPWKRHQEGTVGGHWGLITDPPRQRKFVWGEPVSDHPHWRWQAAGGIVLRCAGVRCGVARAPAQSGGDAGAGAAVACDRVGRRGVGRAGRLDGRGDAVRRRWGPAVGCVRWRLRSLRRPRRWSALRRWRAVRRRRPSPAWSGRLPIARRSRCGGRRAGCCSR